jgi:hypothetical protein
MAKRLVVGLVMGVLIGGLFGFGLAQLSTTLMAGALGYLLAAAVGVLTGLVAGKPIWAKGAQIEAGLKAGVGALLGAGLLFGLRFVPLSLPTLAGIPGAELGRHAIASLAAVSTLLAVFYELDNDSTTDEGEGKKRVDTSTGARVSTTDALEDEEEAPAAKGKRKA